MGRRLAVYVHVDGRWFGPDDDVPAEYASQIGDHAWDDGDPAEPDNGSSDLRPPPLAGKGSGTDAWADYAQSLGVDVPDDAKREDIVDAIRDAGHPVD